MKTMETENEIINENPARSTIRYSISQEQIDDILDNELKGFEFPAKPTYNPHIKDNGRTISEIRGTQKTLKRIEIGKQDNPSREFLIDTILHEYYESEIVVKRLTSDVYWNLDRAIPAKRHRWINKKIAEFFRGKEEI